MTLKDPTDVSLQGSDNDRASKLYDKSVLTGSCLGVPLAILLLIYGLLYARDGLVALTGWSWLRNIRVSSFASVLSVVLLRTLPNHYAAMLVRRADLSRERRVIERFEHAGENAQYALRAEPPFELSPSPVRGRRVFDVSWRILLCFSIGLLVAYTLFNPGETVLSKITMLLGGGYFCSWLIGSAYTSLTGKGPFRANSQSVEGNYYFVPRRVWWEDVATLITTTQYNVLGVPTRTQFRFENAEGKALLVNTALGAGEERSKLADFLRRVCSGQPPQLS